MDLDFSEEQEMLREMVRTLCTEHASIETVRAMEDDPGGYPTEFWKQLAEVEVLGLLIPEEYGGAGMSTLDAAIVYEEFGRTLAPSPHFVSCVLSAGALVLAGSVDQKKEWLPKIAAGDAIFTPAWLEPHNGYGAKGVQMRADTDGESATLSGTKLYVQFASSATRLLVLARSGDGLEDVDLFLVDPNGEGVTLEQQMSLASDTQYNVTLDGARGERIGESGSGWRTWNQVMHEGIILAAAQAIGGAERALEITCEYAAERHQFGKPLAAFQAISHYLADAATHVSGGKTLVLEAAWASSEAKDISRLAPMAKLFACQTYRDLTAMSLQVFGGVGFTIEYDAQLYFRRAKQLQLSWWDTSYLEELVAASVLD
ncbi:MAG: acyl-CoA dehydrogenase family protein [Deltaproteobacteria bacterium]|nr:acyl-CoA dehydrogenase family protein [Deltaproteobacteria bacterium]MBW2384914.1 acyl-CoA dehydrogenase family protein [Deltaproteobacteria bacterium]MBW2698048.1 acyl-CoA dehydrogenase family protein [Deltaproteobacteria bacterium]